MRQELERVLKAPQFTSSKRYPAFLRYIVEKELDGHREWLKERTIGVDVFHRPPDYDTSNDTVVRFTAGEVRRRLALLYHESPGEHSIQIGLPTGSYVPEFFRLAEQATEANVSSQPLPEAVRNEPSLHGISFSRRPAWWQLGALTLLIAILAAGSWFLIRARGAKPSDAMAKFWGPVEVSNSSVLICPGAGAGVLEPAFSSVPTAASQTSKTDRFASVEMERAVADVTYLFGVRHVQYIVQLPPEVNLTQLRENPVLLFGAYSNKWTLQLAKDLRYRFSPEPAEIFDATNPSVHWGTQGISPDNGVDDFSLVARYHDTTTDTSVVIVAGLGSSGTEAAAEFITSPRYLEQLNHSLPPGWEKKNLEIVLESRVIEGKSSGPSIKATYTW